MTKDSVCFVSGLVGSVISSMFGGWTQALTTLLCMMAVDYISGLICAGVFHASTKTVSGALESSTGFKGLFRKGMILAIVWVAYQLDLVIGSSVIKDGVCIAYIVNEAISIIENAGLMGVPVPDQLKNAIDALRKKE